MDDKKEKALSQFSQAKVLVVEDFDLNLEIIVDMLNFLGLSAETALNGSLAVDKVKSAPYDLILMDMRMPVMDGYEATKIIRKLPNKKAPLIIALTASSGIREEAGFKELGMDDILVKPIELEELEKTLRKHFEAYYKR